MEVILEKLRLLLPEVNLAEGDTFCWSPTDRTITYQATSEGFNILSLLHEASHALLDHKNYVNDFNLLLMEVEAWEKAHELARELNVDVDEEYIQDRLDTYRDWLHQRSTCPRCESICLQSSPIEYHCHNCSANWRVSSSRFCRPYRLKNKGRPEIGTSFTTTA